MARFKKVMVATRGESAVRVIRACMELGLPTVTIYTEQDANAIHIVKAGQASLVTPGPVAGYLDFAQIIDKARAAGADAIHPGYGFGAENADFAQAPPAAAAQAPGPYPILTPYTNTDLTLTHKGEEVKARLQGVGSGRRDKQVLFINIGDRIEEIGV